MDGVNEFVVYGPFPLTVIVLLVKEGVPLHEEDGYALKTRVPVRVP
jgi:hypothetical protein